MGPLIRLHRRRDNTEVLVNPGQIALAEPISHEGGEHYTRIVMASGRDFLVEVRESLDEILAQGEAAAQP